MKTHTLTKAQIQRLKELRGIAIAEKSLPSIRKRDEVFEKIVKDLERKNREIIKALFRNPLRNSISNVENEIASLLISMGFLEVKTPIVISASSIKKIGINENHPLWNQIFWIGKNRCLRPMLAPNLYFLLSHLRRNVKMPLRIFETGPCFRKESRSSIHMEEFTMLNLVELGPTTEPIERLKELFDIVMKHIGLSFKLETKKSAVYGETIDAVVNEVEVASGVVGPHFLDRAYGITEPWVGIGFGIERILLLTPGLSEYSNIRRVGRSLIYLGGARIDV